MLPNILKMRYVRESKEDAYKFAKILAQKEGILAGISTGATLAAISKKLPGIGENKVIMGFNYDTGERYLSIEGLY